MAGDAKGFEKIFAVPVATVRFDFLEVGGSWKVGLGSNIV
jgi:hypothetical protein